MKNINKSTERAGGNDSSEGNSNSNENKSQDSKIKGLTGGAGENKKISVLSKNVLGNPIGVRAFKSVAKKGTSKLKTQSSVQLMKKVHKKSMLSNPSGHLLAVPGHHPALGQA
jgi:hypothetical protein